MCILHIEAAKEASQRTRNRIRERGPLFSVVDTGTPICMGGKEALLVESDEWIGWLPSDEIVAKIKTP